MATLYVTDMDGTLLNADSQVSNNTAKIISQLSHDGALITVATARTPATVQPLLSDTFTRLPAIVMTGASLWDRNNLTYINPHIIPDLSARDIKVCACAHDINLFTYVLDDNGFMNVYHNGQRSPKEVEFIQQRIHLELKHFYLDSDYGLAPFIPNTILYFALGPRDKIFSLAEELKATVKCSVSNYVDIFGQDIGILEVFAPNVSKAAAVKALADEYRADRIVVFGDNLNDIPMMQVADVAIAVGNALPEVKAIADLVIGNNTDDAVAHFIASDYKAQ